MASRIIIAGAVIRGDAQRLGPFPVPNRVAIGFVFVVLFPFSRRCASCAIATSSHAPETSASRSSRRRIG
jgi:hypothetical protein